MFCNQARTNALHYIKMNNNKSSFSRGAGASRGPKPTFRPAPKADALSFAKQFVPKASLKNKRPVSSDSSSSYSSSSSRGGYSSGSSYSSGGSSYSSRDNGGSRGSSYSSSPRSSYGGSQTSYPNTPLSLIHI